MEKLHQMPTSRRGLLSSLRALGTRFRRDEEGVVAIEFALIAPMLIALFLAMTGLTNAIWAKAKTSHASSIIGDLIAQSTVMDSGTMQTWLSAAPALMSPFDGEGITVTTVQTIGCLTDEDDTDSDMDYYVIWGQQWTEETGLANAGFAHASKFDAAPDGLKVAHDTYLVVTTVEMDHSPPITYSKLNETYQLSEVSFNAPRTGAAIVFEGATDEQNTATCADM